VERLGVSIEIAIPCGAGLFSRTAMPYERLGRVRAKYPPMVPVGSSVAITTCLARTVAPAAVASTTASSFSSTSVTREPS